MPFDATPVKQDSEVVTVLKKAREINPIGLALRRARDLIEEPRHWRKRSYGAWPWSRSWCGIGALRKVALGTLEYDPAYRILNSVAPPYFSVWNDAPERTHADVMAAFDRAIDLAEQSNA